MPAFTSFLNLYKPGGGSSGLILPDEVADIDRLNQNSDLIDAWAQKVGDPASNRQVNYVGLAAAMGGTLVPPPKDGDTYQETDGNKILWKRVGGVWVTNENGAYLIRPGVAPTVVGSGASVSVDAAGQINFTNIPAGGRLNLDSIFSTRFNDYSFVSRYKFTSDGGFSLLLRGGGADRTSLNYRYAIMRTDGSPGFSGTNGNIPVGGAAGTHYYMEMDVHDPMIAEATSYQIRTARSSAAGAPATDLNSGLYAISGLDDGLAFTHTAGTGAVSGHIKIYARP